MAEGGGVAAHEFITFEGSSKIEEGWEVGAALNVDEGNVAKRAVDALDIAQLAVILVERHEEIRDTPEVLRAFVLGKGNPVIRDIPEHADKNKDIREGQGALLGMPWDPQGRDSAERIRAIIQVAVRSVHKRSLRYWEPENV